MGQRGSGHLAVPGWFPDTEPGQTDPRCRDEVVGKPAWTGCMCASTLVSLRLGRPATERPRPEPDWGKPTVRDRRGACGNVSIMGAGLRPIGKSMEPPPYLGCCARCISIPTNGSLCSLVATRNSRTCTIRFKMRMSTSKAKSATFRSLSTLSKARIEMKWFALLDTEEISSHPGAAVACCY